MEVEKVKELIFAFNGLKTIIDEAKNLVFNGKIIQCDRKLQSAQVRCINILEFLLEVYKLENPDAVVDDTNTQEK